MEELAIKNVSIKRPKAYSTLFDFVLELVYTIWAQISDAIFCIPLCWAIGILWNGKKWMVFFFGMILQILLQGGQGEVPNRQAD